MQHSACRLLYMHVCELEIQVDEINSGMFRRIHTFGEKIQSPTVQKGMLGIIPPDFKSTWPKHL